MTLNRRDWLAAVALGGPYLVRAADPPRTGLGVVIHSFGIRSRVERDMGFNDPVRFAEFCRNRGSAGVQLPIGVRTAEAARAIRSRFDELGMYLEGSIVPPRNDADLDRFEAEVRTAKEAGADVLRTVMLGGRRYEVFQTADEYRAFKERSWASLQLAAPVVARHKVRLAVENHKDYRTDELVGLMRRLKNDFVGVTVDTGNNIALLDDPHDTVKALAPWAMSIHLKDMAVKESADGFLLSEVPLGDGYLDLKWIVGTLQKANPAVRFNLEMITRDPLRVPCLADGYWATFADLPGRDLARTLAAVRRHAAKADLPRVSGLPVADQLAAEDDNVRRSFLHYQEKLGA
jgi:sugar phosphate isomerase/epimerase